MCTGRLWIGFLLLISFLVAGCSYPRPVKQQQVVSLAEPTVTVPTMASTTSMPRLTAMPKTASPTTIPQINAQRTGDSTEGTLSDEVEHRTQIPSPVTAATEITPLSPADWKDFPVIPQISDRVKEIYAHGVALGNNPRAFSKVGDCGSTPAWFLGDFDRGSNAYSLGEYQYLEQVINEFQGSYSRTSLAAKAGFNASSVFAQLWANREICQPDETPLACEYRVNRPILAFIMLGSNDVWHEDSFEPQMRRIIEYSIDNGVIPVLSTKADNIEKNGAINQTIAKLAIEYDLPLLNYWRAIQPLPSHGLQEDEVHITWAPNRFDDPKAMRAGWPVRNLATLQTLDVIWRTVTDKVVIQPLPTW